MDVVELSEAEFSKFESKSKYGNFYQTSEHAILRRELGFTSFLLGLKEGDRLLAVASLIERRGLAKITMGPLLDFDNVDLLRAWIKKLISFCMRKGFVDVRVELPLIETVYDGGGATLKKVDRGEIIRIFKEAGFEQDEKSRQVKFCIKDLQEFSSAATLRASYDEGIRDILSEVGPLLEVKELASREELADFCKLVFEGDRKLGTQERRLEYWKRMWTVFGDKIHFVMARKKESGVAVAGLAYLERPDEFVVLAARAATRYEKYKGKSYLRDWVLNKALKSGRSRVNFGEVVGDSIDFGVEFEEYLGALHLVLDRERYSKELRRRKVDAGLRRVRRGGSALLRKINLRQTKVVRKVKAKKSSK